MKNLSLEEARKKYEGFYKVDEVGGTYVVATLWNPLTDEIIRTCIYNGDYSEEAYAYPDEEAYNMPMANEEIITKWKHRNGIILVNDFVKIVKGRKMVGEIKKVVKEFSYKIKEVYHCYVDYLVFEDGTKVIKDNCELFING